MVRMSTLSETLDDAAKSATAPIAQITATRRMTGRLAGPDSRPTPYESEFAGRDAHGIGGHSIERDRGKQESESRQGAR